MMTIGVLMLMIGNAWQAWVNAGDGDSAAGSVVAATGYALCAISLSIYAWRVFP